MRHSLQAEYQQQQLAPLIPQTKAHTARTELTAKIKQYSLTNSTLRAIAFL